MAINGLLCADVLLRNCVFTYWQSDDGDGHPEGVTTNKQKMYSSDYRHAMQHDRLCNFEIALIAVISIHICLL